MQLYKNVSLVAQLCEIELSGAEGPGNLLDCG